MIDDSAKTNVREEFEEYRAGISANPVSIALGYASWVLNEIF